MTNTARPIIERITQQDRNVEWDYIHNRLGKFSISRDLVEHEPGVLMRVLFSQMLIIHVDINSYYRAYEYTAHSVLFDEIERGQEVPHYEFVFYREGWDSPVIEQVIRHDQPAPEIRERLEIVLRED